MTQVSEDILKVLNSLPGAVMISRATGTGDGEILYTNRRFLEMFDCESFAELKALSGGSPIGLVYPDDVNSARWYIHERSEKPLSAGYVEKVGDEQYGSRSMHMQYRVMTKMGRILEVTEIAHYVQDPEEGSLVYSILYQAGEGISARETDYLTGLPNMRAFLNYAEKAAQLNRSREDARPVYYLYLNLAHFKRYNRRHGIDDGDWYLRKTSEVLRECFKDGYIARFDADHFAVFTMDPEYREAVKKAHDEIGKIREEATVELKAGVYAVLTSKSDIAVNAACDLAKIACDSIGNNADVYIRVYDQKLADEAEQRDYIVENIQKAVDSGWIEVWYQPVVRSISGALCGFEALTRWIDPKYGFMNPGMFIPVLEESHLIHKLDIYVVEQVCRRIHSEIARGEKPVPVSFNLSRIDFMLCDCFGIIEETVRKYNVPRDMIRIEITESTVMNDRQAMSAEIRRFRAADYQVWMDDFGSGYSSLNMLKDFYFDEIKLDMEFLRSFTPASREIVASTVRMAKKLGMHTLAEGVETQEQADFLRGIGCEKMQGYYFGKPQPFAESMRHCLEDKGLALETRSWTGYFDRLGTVNLQTERPLAVIDCDNAGMITLLYNNRPCEQLVKEMGYGSMANVMDIVKKSPSVTVNKIISTLIDTDWENGDVREKTMFLTENNHVVKLEIGYIALASAHRAFTVYVSDLTNEEAKSEISLVDGVLRNLVLNYDNIYVVHFDHDYMEVKFQGMFFNQKPGTRYHDLNRQLQDYTKEVIYPPDQERFLAFMDTDTMVSRIRKNSSGNILGEFRVSSGKSAYRWKVFNCILTPDSEENTAIITMRDSILVNDPDAVKIYTKRFDEAAAAGTFENGREEEANYQTLMAAVSTAASSSFGDRNTARGLADDSLAYAEMAQEAYQMNEKENASVYDGESRRQKDLRLRGSEALVLWGNMLNALPVNLFWKDKDRKFISVSRQCLRTIGMEGENILGRTADELGNALTSEAVDNMEKRVLAGKSVENYPAKLLIRGGVHNILISESPFFRDGEIGGLMGCIIDTENVRTDRERFRQSQVFDTAAGTMNSRGVLEALFTYNDACSIYGIGYDVILVNVATWKTEVDLYGEELAVPILSRAGESLRSSVGYSGFVGRLTDGVFAVMRQRRKGSSSLEELEEKIQTGIESIHQVDGHNVTLRAELKAVSSDDAAGPDQMMVRIMRTLSEFWQA